MKLSVHAIPHQSRPVGARQLPPGGSQGGRYVFARDFTKAWVPAANPSVRPLGGLPAPLSGALFSLPLLGEVPRSGKGGAVGIFEPLPFNEPHPLSQAVRPASSPIGEPSEGDTNSPKFHKTASTCRETPLRLAKSRLAAVARLHGACGRTSQALWACQLSFA